jgi:hypothetical protein
LQTSTLFGGSRSGAAEDENRQRLQMTAEIMDLRLSATIGNDFYKLHKDKGVSLSRTEARLGCLEIALDLSLTLRKATSKITRSQKVRQLSSSQRRALLPKEIGHDESMDFLKELQDIGSRISSIGSQSNLTNDGFKSREKCLHELQFWFCHVCLNVSVLLPRIG